MSDRTLGQTSRGQTSSGQPLRIGEVLVAQGKLTPDQAGRTVITSLERGVRFGEAAIALGYVTDADVARALEQRDVAIAYRPTVNVSDVAILQDHGSDTADGIRRLARTLAMRWFGGADPHRALSIISADRGEGRTTLALNLACAFALGGARTLLIDGDLENSRLDAVLGIRGERTGANADPDAGDDPDAHPGLDNLAFIPAAALAHAGADRLLPVPYSELIDAYSARFDVIFVDTPAASISTDYLHAAQATGGAIVVGRQGATRTRTSVKMLNACEDQGVEIVGGAMLI